MIPLFSLRNRSFGVFFSTKLMICQITLLVHLKFFEWAFLVHIRSIPLHLKWATMQIQHVVFTFLNNTSIVSFSFRIYEEKKTSTFLTRSSLMYKTFIVLVSYIGSIGRLRYPSTIPWFRFVEIFVRCSF